MVETDRINQNSVEKEMITKQRAEVTRLTAAIKKSESTDTEQKKSSSTEDDYRFEMKHLIWRNVIYLGYLHLCAVYGIYQIFTGQCKLATILMVILLIHWGALGITAGAHRLWCHKAYKAKWQLKLILTFFNTIAHHNGIWYWVIIHRQHHKYQDTHADPHNARRGLFFSQIGWVLVEEHPDVIEKRKTINMSDVQSDPFVMIQKKYYWILTLLISVVLPIWILCYFFDESLSVAWHVGFAFRHVYILNDIFLINSYAHAVGTKPYDTKILPTENRLLSIMTQGEGWHNYHHTFPWDYKAAELGNWRYNITTGFIDLFAAIGWAYDLKTVSNETIQKRMARSGDMNLKYSNATIDDLMRLQETKHDEPNESKGVWGWNDPDLDEKLKKTVTILHKIE